MSATQTPSQGQQQFVATRYFDAPRELMFKLWTDPKHLAAWWGPKHFTNPVSEWDVRVGGQINVQMRGPDGVLYPMTGEYKQVVPNEKLVFICGVPDGSGKRMFEVQNIATFKTEGKGTSLMLQALVVSRSPASEQYLKGMAEGWSQSLDKLAQFSAEVAAEQPTTARSGEEVAKLSAEHPPFIISHTYKGPRDLVWKAWTELDRLKQWFGPKGFTMPFAKMDFRPGGMMLYKLQAPDGSPMWGKFVYQEITPPDKLVWINSFSDEHGGTTRHPMAPTWPAEMLTTVTLTEHQGQTTVTVRSEAFHASPAEQKTFTDNHKSMTGGWTGTFEQLAEYLAKA